jgi:hypothetical protein
MKRVLIKIFIFPWKLAHHSNLADILVFFFSLVHGVRYIIMHILPDF